MHRQQCGDAVERRAVTDARWHGDHRGSRQPADHAGQRALHAGQDDDRVGGGDAVEVRQHPMQPGDAHVVDATRKADCVFDVMVTGNAGFGKSYEIAQGFSPAPPGWFSPVPAPECPECKDPKPCEHPWWCSWTCIAIGLLILVLLVLLVLRSRKKP